MRNVIEKTTLDDQQFERLFKMHFKALTLFAQQFVADLDTAQDLCQKVFISLWEKRSQIDLNQSIKSYLYTAVRNRCLNHIRDHQKFRSTVLDLDCANFDILEMQPFDTPHELKQKIDLALQSLPEKCRQVFEMSRLQQLKYREIAEELNISQKTVEAHMRKALQTLRTHLKDYLALILATLTWWFFSLFLMIFYLG